MGFIYKITPHECCEFYIGSTTDMEIREKTHNQSVKTDPRKVYVKIREMGGFNMELLYEYECETEQELRMEEQRCMDKMKPTLNTQRAFTSDDDLKKYRQQYNKANIDTIQEQQKQYNIDNQEKIREQKKQYYNANIDTIRERDKQYRIKNREAINKKAKEKRAKAKLKLKCN